MDVVRAEANRADNSKPSVAPAAAVGRYALRERLAAGPLSELFAADARHATAQVAVERFNEDLGRDAQFGRTLLAQARHAALLSHRNIVPLFELGRAGDVFYAIKQRVRGLTLREIVEARFEPPALPPSIVAGIGASCAEALAYAHSVDTAGGVPVLHGNLTAGRILIDRDGIPLILDFGVAEATLPYRRTSSDWPGLELPYRAPEQVRDEPVDGRADIYALGVILFELLAGCRPYAVTSEEALLGRIDRGSPPTPRLLVDSTPVELDAIVRRCIAPARNDRYDNAGRLARELRHFERESGHASGVELVEVVRELIAPSGIERSRLDNGDPAINTADRVSATAGEKVTLVMSDEELTQLLGGPDDAPDWPDSEQAQVAAMPTGPDPEDDLVFSSVEAWLRAESCETDADDWVLYVLDDVDLEPPPIAPVEAVRDTNDWTLGPPAGALAAMADTPPALDARAAPHGRSRFVAPLILASALGISAGLLAVTMGLDANSDSAGAQAEPAAQSLRRSAAPGEPVEISPPRPPATTMAPEPEAMAEQSRPREPPEPAALRRAQHTPGKLAIQVTPWGEVWIDEKKIGVTPLVPVQLQPGRHTVEVLNPETGNRVTKVVLVPAGKTRRLRLNLDGE